MNLHSVIGMGVLLEIVLIILKEAPPWSQRKGLMIIVFMYFVILKR